MKRMRQTGMVLWGVGLACAAVAPWFAGPGITTAGAIGIDAAVAIAGGAFTALAGAEF